MRISDWSSDVCSSDLLHNIAMHDFQRDYAFCADVHPQQTPAKALTFDGIVRADGSVATRNYIGNVSSVNCSAMVCRQIADAFRGDGLADYPNVDGVVDRKSTRLNSSH